MNNLAILKQTAQTMSSRELAQLCDKEHRNVLRDIDLLNETYTHMGLPKIEQGYYTHPSTGSQQHREFLLTKEQSIDLVTGYRADIRIRINRRWAELEAQNNSPALPNFADPVQAARAWADAVEKQQLAIAQVAELQPKADALDVISTASNSLNLRETAKTLGVQEKKFVAWCIKHDWLYRDAKSKLCPIAHRIQKGFLEQRAVPFTKPNGETGVSTQAMFTAKALTHLAKIFSVIHEVA
jgi:phage antirepressor YoqD-like protein